MKHINKVKINKYTILYLFIFSTLFISCKTTNTLPDPLGAGWKGKKVCEIIEENNSARILKCVFPPGVGHEKHYHKPHFAYTIKGSRFKIEDKNGRREVDVKTGLHYYSKGVDWHTARNIGDSTSTFLIIELK